MLETALLNLLDGGILKLCLLLVYYLLYHECRSEVFERAGKRGFSTLIPIYGGMKQFEIAKMSKLWYFFKFIPILVLYKPLFSVWLFLITLIASAVVNIVREVRTVEYVFVDYYAFKGKKIGILLYLFQVSTWMYLLLTTDGIKTKPRAGKKQIVSTLLVISIATTTLFSGLNVRQVNAAVNEEIKISKDLINEDITLDNYDKFNSNQQNIIYSKAAYSLLYEIQADFPLEPGADFRLVNFKVSRAVYQIIPYRSELFPDCENIYFVGTATFSKDNANKDTWQEERILLVEEVMRHHTSSYPKQDFESANLLQELDLQILKDYQEINYPDLEVSYDIEEHFYESKYDQYIEALLELQEKTSNSKAVYEQDKDSEKVNSTAYKKLKAEIDTQNQILLEVQTLDNSFSRLLNETEETRDHFSEKTELVEKYINKWLEELNEKMPNFTKYIQTEDPYTNAVNWVDTNIVNPDSLGKLLLVQSGRGAVTLAGGIAAGPGGAMLANESLDLLEGIMVGVIYASNLVDQGVPIIKAVSEGTEEGLQRYFLDKGLEVVGSAILSKATKNLSEVFGNTKLGKICKGMSDSLVEGLGNVKQSILPNIKYLDLTENELEESIFNIDKFIGKEITFDEAKDDLAKLYTTVVLQDEKWTWNKNVCPGLTKYQQKKVREYAREVAYLPKVKITNVNGVKYADFYESGYVEYVGYLEKSDYKKTSAEQIKIMNEIAKEQGIDIEGKTWHHALEEGRMELVPTGIHNSTYHKGGNYFWGSNK